ncbi:uncharacterized protein CIMG_04111 [Coccidioides immitis RS]|uniref:Uncharacterized protein n=1 Tax=Coccidioides immitis (strain RS) TaxID=246410 RepID=J3KCT6_COCIM|nr:uncharacterized protein CIMG_04111 [Coccidioides immitis RS]EAS33087.3 hypothetical protein CIMG_04111 [Coccidioides immitis RS]
MNHIPFSKQAPNVAIAANHEGEADPRALQYAKNEVGYERFLQCSVEDGSMTGRDETDGMERGRIEKHGIPICAPGPFFIEQSWLKMAFEGWSKPESKQGGICDRLECGG